MPASSWWSSFDIVSKSLHNVVNNRQYIGSLASTGEEQRAKFWKRPEPLAVGAGRSLGDVPAVQMRTVNTDNTPSRHGFHWV